jgi:hypothetical protein
MVAEIPVIKGDIDRACSVFNRSDDVPTNVVYRFRVGIDAQPEPFDPIEAAAELHDAFAQDLLLRGSFPTSGAEVLTLLAGLASAGGRDDQLDHQQFFLLGEGSQIPVSPATGPVVRALRFLVACGPDGGPDPSRPGPDILVSAFNPEGGTTELMAWDHGKGGFNFYRTFGETDTAWVFAGNSRDALTAATRARGPFESHRGGNVLMKELRAPWIHWHSIDAAVDKNVLAPNNPIRNHPWFLAAIGDQRGALNCETRVVRPSIDRWVRTHFDALVADGTPTDAEPIFTSVLDTPTVNITCSHQHGDPKLDPDGQAVELPFSFFVDLDAFGADKGGLGLLTDEPTLSVPRDVYDATLTAFDVHLSDGFDFQRPGDTFFAFTVPERAYEDHRTVVEARRIGLLSDRLAATFLMTDFPNPIFSTRRAALLAHIPATVNIAEREQFSDAVAIAIVAAASRGSPEAEFAELWAAGDNWREVFGKKLSDYLGAVAHAAQTEAGFHGIYRVAVSRRKQMVDTMPIAEFGLLFPVSDVEATPVVLHTDATAHSVTP